MALAVDGLVSGLDTTALINSLMQVEALPQSALKSKVSSTQSLISAFQKLNTSIAALAESAKKTAKPDALNIFAATSSAASVTASAGSTATPGTLEFTVEATALAHRIVTAPMQQWDKNPATLTFRIGGVDKVVTAKSASLDDVVSAVNAAGVGVTAAKVQAGTDAQGNQLYRLQFTATETGTKNAFTVSNGSGPSATDIESKKGGGTLVQAARDASILLWAGTAAQQRITSSDNTFDGVLTGVDITVTKAEPATVTVTIKRDDTKASALVKSLVAGIAEILASIAAQSSVTSSTDSGGRTSAKAGIFTGDFTARDAASRLRNAVIAPVDGRSPSEIGITITKTGAIEFDAEKFEKAMRDDPTRTAAAVATISGRIEGASRVLSDRYDGLITSRITGQESRVRDFGKQISDWDQRLTARRLTLERMFSAMEVQLGTLNSQSSWLASQLGSLSAGNAGAGS